MHYGADVAVRLNSVSAFSSQSYSAVSGNELVNISATLPVLHQADTVQRVLFGAETCNLLGPAENGIVLNQGVICRTPADMSPGFYNVTLDVRAKGYSDADDYTFSIWGGLFREGWNGTIYQVSHKPPP